MARRKTADGQTGLFENAVAPHPARDAGHLPPRGKATDGSVWEMKKRGSVGVISTAPYCGYSEATLRSLRERGWHLYKDGKRLD